MLYALVLAAQRKHLEISRMQSRQQKKDTKKELTIIY